MREDDSVLFLPHIASLKVTLVGMRELGIRINATFSVYQAVISW